MFKPLVSSAVAFLLSHPHVMEVLEGGADSLESRHERDGFADLVAEVYGLLVNSASFHPNIYKRLNVSITGAYEQHVPFRCGEPILSLREYVKVDERLAFLRSVEVDEHAGNLLAILEDSCSAVVQGDGRDESASFYKSLVRYRSAAKSLIRSIWESASQMSSRLEDLRSNEEQEMEDSLRMERAVRCLQLLIRRKATYRKAATLR